MVILFATDCGYVVAADWSCHWTDCGHVAWLTVAMLSDWLWSCCVTDRGNVVCYWLWSCCLLMTVVMLFAWLWSCCLPLTVVMLSDWLWPCCLPMTMVMLFANVYSHFVYLTVVMLFDWLTHVVCTWQKILQNELQHYSYKVYRILV